ncbi:glycosyltransferase [Flexivirga alba]|uniref:Glycosyltransferase n=1 Tax=Flexivirga alba TaxID=702742 RepID=A0ABW2AE38_9MICO
MSRVGVVMVAYGAEPYLHAAVSSALESADIDVRVVVVDNGADQSAIDSVRNLPGVTVVAAPGNIGFGAGCNLGVKSTDADVLVLLNCDVLVDPGALGQLTRALRDPEVGIATASIRLADQTEVVNSAGNPVHYLGLAWAGGHGEPVAAHYRSGRVASASGACCAVTRPWWDALGGFDPEYFAYHEDVELSIRTWQRGRSVLYVADAIAWHHYEFSRNPRKLYLLERNRLLTLLTTYSTRTLLLLAPALVTQEVGLVALSIGQGWFREKVAGYGWLIRHRGQVADRNRQLQTERSRSDREVMAHFTARYDPGNVPLPFGLGMVNGLSAGYERLVRRWL